MTRRSAQVPVGTRRPGPRRVPSADGAVTVEAAVGVLALVAVTAVLVWAIGLLGAQLAVGEAARAAARMAARGESADAVRAEARRLVPAADVDLRTDVDHVVVEVSRSVTPPGALGRLGQVRLRAESSALVEEP